MWPDTTKLIFAFAQLCLTTFKSFRYIKKATLSSGPSSAPFLQYSSGTSFDFLAKIVGVHNPLFPWKTQFYFTISSLWLHILLKCSTSIFLNCHVCHGNRGRQISFIFKSLHLFFSFLILFTFENNRSAVGFSTFCD